MDEEDPFEPVYTFFFAWFGLTLALFPLVATIDSTVFDENFGSLAVLVTSGVVTIPAALEFVFSDRNPRFVGVFVIVFVALYFVAIVLQASVYVMLGRETPVPAVEFSVLFVTYVIAYGLVYRIKVARFMPAFAR